MSDRASKALAEASGLCVTGSNEQLTKHSENLRQAKLRIESYQIACA
jgi:hypothetical protein